MRHTLARHWFFIGLGLVIMIALAVPDAGVALRERGLVRAAIWLAFLVVGLTLRTRQLVLQSRAMLPLATAAGSSLLLLPLLGWFLANAVFGPHTDYSVGVVIMMAAPVTIASGTVMTAMAGGNVALSLLICVTGNAMALLTIPVLVPALTGGQTPLDLPTGALFADLARMVLVPTVAGQVLRVFLETRIDASRRVFPFLSQGVVLLIVFNAISASASPLLSTGGALLWLALFMAGLHGAALLLNYGLARALRLDYGSAAAFILHVSQKTLTVSYVVWAGYFAERFPLAMLPGILYHIIQSIAGTALARWYGRQACLAHRSE